MRIKRRLAQILAMVWAGLVMADSAAQSADRLKSAYVGAIYAVVQDRWEHSPYYTEVALGSHCAVLITQMRGGNILSTQVTQDCNFNEAGRAAVISAIRSASPLPYDGFEETYQREIRFVFRAPTLDEIEANVSFDAEAEKRRRMYEASPETRNAEAHQLRDRTADYVARCRMHLVETMAVVTLKNRAQLPVSVMIDKAGKVVRAFSENQQGVEEGLAAALFATQPCEVVPDDIMAGRKEMEIEYVVVHLHY